ncbi:MAG: ABC transporter permease [Clostridia bacterium]|nr:ABC transporter permease [Clostridia bacterium]
MITYFKNIFQNRNLILSFVRQDLRARYRRSVLGMLWAILTPLGMTVIIASVYSLLWKSDIHYFVPYLFSGLTPWSFLLASCDAGAMSYIAAEGYIKQLPIKLEIFPLRVVSTAFINNLMFGLLAYYIVVIFLAPEMITLWTLMVLPAMLLFFVLAVSLATLAATAQVYTRDYAPMQSLVFQALFYVTPILYDYTMFDQMGYAFIYEINPIFYFIQIMRDALMGRAPNGQYWMIAVLIATVVFLLSQYVFNKTKKKIVFRL